MLSLINWAILKHLINNSNRFSLPRISRYHERFRCHVRHDNYCGGRRSILPHRRMSASSRDATIRRTPFKLASTFSSHCFEPGVTICAWRVGDGSALYSTTVSELVFVVCVCVCTWVCMWSLYVTENDGSRTRVGALLRPAYANYSPRLMHT